MMKRKILGILPARGGSKGVPGKNLRMLKGRPLLGWAAEALCSCDEIDRRICSTDDAAIAQAAGKFGLEVPFMRPAELARDDTPVTDVIRHALDELDDRADPYTHVALVQATSPTVTADDLSRAVAMLDEGDPDTVITGFVATSQHPSLMFTMAKGGQVRWLLGDGSHGRRRQDLPPVFVRTGLLYLFRTANIRERNSIYGGTIAALVIDEARSVNIDEERDFERAERIMGNME